MRLASSNHGNASICLRFGHKPASWLLEHIFEPIWPFPVAFTFCITMSFLSPLVACFSITTWEPFIVIVYASICALSSVSWMLSHQYTFMHHNVNRLSRSSSSKRKKIPFSSNFKFPAILFANQYTNTPLCYGRTTKVRKLCGKSKRFLPHARVFRFVTVQLLMEVSTVNRSRGLVDGLIASANTFQRL